jgi:phosphoribosyl-ATP pyrophosphohydrolase
MTNNPLDDIRDFNLNRYGSVFNKDKFKVTLEEELKETYDAIEANDQHELVDGICDCLVILTGALTQLGYNPTETLKEVVKHITSRKQDLNQKTRWIVHPEFRDSEKWQKSKIQQQAEIYQPDFESCRLCLNYF